MPDLSKYKGAIPWIISFEVMAMVIGLLTEGSVESWYAMLIKPPYTPPNFLFPIVWFVLYALMGVAAWYLWHQRKQKGMRELHEIFWLYTGMNWSWSFIFFSLQMISGGFAWLVTINFICLLLVATAWQRARLVAYLMLPVLLWTIFAAYLSGGYWYLNPLV